MDTLTKPSNDASEPKKGDDKKTNNIFLVVTILAMLLIFLAIKTCS